GATTFVTTELPKTRRAPTPFAGACRISLLRCLHPDLLPRQLAIRTFHQPKHASQQLPGSIPMRCTGAQVSMWQLQIPTAINMQRPNSPWQAPQCLELSPEEAVAASACLAKPPNAYWSADEWTRFRNYMVTPNPAAPPASQSNGGLIGDSG